MITIWRVWVASWKHLVRNGWMTVATVFVFFLALVSVNVLLTVNAMLDRVGTLLEQRVDVTLSFKASAPKGVVDQARFYLSSLPQVQSIDVVSPDDVLRQFRERHSTQPHVLSALQELPTNPFGAELILKAKHAEDYPFLLKAMQNPQYTAFIESQTYDDHRSAIARVNEIANKLRIAGSALVAIFAFFGLLMAFHAVRVAIFTHKEEILVMRLVGAGSGFIRMPFVLEGVWIACLSGVFVVAAMIGLLAWGEPLLRPLFDGGDTGIVSFFSEHLWEIIAIEGSGLLVLSAFVSWMAVGKYMKR